MILQRLTLKQFRDAEEPDRACFQALIHEPWTLSNPRRVNPLKRTAINVYRYPSLPLVETLGLQCNKRIPPKEMRGAIADVLHSEDPFRLELGIEIGLGEVISHAGGSQSWTFPAMVPLQEQHIGVRLEALLGKEPLSRFTPSRDLGPFPELGPHPDRRTLPNLGNFLDLETLKCCGLQPLVRAFVEKYRDSKNGDAGEEGSGGDASTA